MAGMKVNADLKTDMQRYVPDEYWESLLTTDAGSAAVCWPDWPASYNRWLHIQQCRTFFSLLQEYNISLEGKAVCETGPGVGFWTEQFRQSGVKAYHGFEISRSAVERLRSRFDSFTFTCADFSEYIPSENETGRCDFGLSVLVFLHVTDNEKFAKCVKNMSQLLADGAYLLVLDAVSVNGLYGATKNAGDTPLFDGKTHNKIRFYDSYCTVYRDAGLRLCDVRPAFTFSQPSFDFPNALTYGLFALYRRLLLFPLLRLGNERAGNLIGRALVGLDEKIWPMTGRGFSSKWFIFRKERSGSPLGG